MSKINRVNKQWQAKWIRDPRFGTMKPVRHEGKEYRDTVPFQHRNDLLNHHMLMRKVIRISTDCVSNVSMELTADDYYKLYINGKFVTQGPAQNEPSHYYYNRLDITNYLHPGDNIVALHIYYQGLVNRAFNSGDYRQGLIAEIYVNHQLHTITDATWKYKLAEEYGGGQPYGYDTQFPEHIDARKLAKGWRELRYLDEDWPFAEEASSVDYSFILQPTPQLSVYEKNPANITELSAGHYLVDFGQEITGQFTCDSFGASGDTVEIRCGEELDESGKGVRYELRCNCTYREIWTLSGQADQLEFYDYKAFRYVEVIDPAGAVQPRSFAAIVRHYPFDDNSSVFRSSDPLPEQIFNLCKNGVKYGSQENFVDCPTREKGQYLGDNTIITHSHMLLSGDLRLTRKAIEQFAFSSAICPGLMGVVPGNLMQEVADFSLQWPLQVMNYYQQSGDLAFVKEMYPYAQAIIDYFQKYVRGDGLLDHVKEKWNLVDWPDNLRDGYDFELSRPVGPGCHNVVNAFYYGCLKTVRELGKLLGLSEYAAEMEQVRESYLRSFYRPDSMLFADAEKSSHHSLHGNVLPLLFGLTPDDAVNEAVAFIREKRFSCGVYMSYFVLKALARVGEYELVYKLITSTGERSWANMIKEGATTCFEAWGKDQKWNTSLCHPWASAPVPVLIEDIIGLQPNKPGWEEIRFTPHIPAGMADFTFQMRVRTGIIRVTHKDEKTTIHSSIPVAELEACTIKGS